MGVNIEEKVIEALTNRSNVKKVNPNMYLNEIGIDSLTYVEVGMDLEEELDITYDLAVLDYTNMGKDFGIPCPSPKVSDVIRTVEEVYKKFKKEHSH